MIIDFHTHIFPDAIAAKTIAILADIFQEKPYLDGTYKGLAESQAGAGIDRSIILPIVTKPSQFESVNSYAATIQGESAISFGSIHPESAHYKEQLQHIKALGLKGIKLHPDYQEVYLDDIRYQRIISYASELGLIIVLHAGVDPKSPLDVHCTPQMIAAIIDKVQPEKLVLAHMGGFDLWDEVERVLVGKQVYFDTGVVLGRMPEEQFVRMIRNHGANKILFGTDSPWAGQTEFVKYMNDISIEEEERECIFFKNALKLLG